MTEGPSRSHDLPCSANAQDLVEQKVYVLDRRAEVHDARPQRVPAFEIGGRHVRGALHDNRFEYVSIQFVDFAVGLSRG